MGIDNGDFVEYQIDESTSSSGEGSAICPNISEFSSQHVSITRSQIHALEGNYILPVDTFFDYDGDNSPDVKLTRYANLWRDLVIKSDIEILDPHIKFNDDKGNSFEAFLTRDVLPIYGVVLTFNDIKINYDDLQIKIPQFYKQYAYGVDLLYGYEVNNELNFNKELSGWKMDDQSYFEYILPPSFQDNFNSWCPPIIPERNNS